MFSTSTCAVSNSGKIVKSLLQNGELRRKFLPTSCGRQTRALFNGDNRPQQLQQPQQVRDLASDAMEKFNLSNRYHGLENNVW